MKLVTFYIFCLGATAYLIKCFSFAQTINHIKKLIQHGISVISSVALSISIHNAPNDHLFISQPLASNVMMSITSSTVVKSKPKDDSVFSLHQQYIKDDFIRGLLSGAVSRASKEILLHPFDTIRARLQVKNIDFVNATSYTAKSNAHSSATMIPEYQKEVESGNTGLFQDLYAGLTPALIGGIPAGAVFFAVKDSTKAFLKSLDNHHEPFPILTSKEFITIFSVVIANVLYWVVRSPAEELKTKQQVGQNTTEFANIKYISEIFNRNGLNAVIQQLYGSYSSNIAYALPADFLKFVAYESISTEVFGAANGVKMSGISAAEAGALSGLVAQLTTTPLDVARTRIMVRSKNTFVTADNSSSVNASSTNIVNVLLDIVRSEGAGSLWRGVIPRALRAIASGGIQFASYELTQNAMK